MVFRLFSAYIILIEPGRMAVDVSLHWIRFAGAFRAVRCEVAEQSHSANANHRG